MTKLSLANQILDQIKFVNKEVLGATHKKTQTTL